MAGFVFLLFQKEKKWRVLLPFPFAMRDTDVLSGVCCAVGGKTMFVCAAVVTRHLHNSHNVHVEVLVSNMSCVGSVQ